MFPTHVRLPGPQGVLGGSRLRHQEHLGLARSPGSCSVSSVHSHAMGRRLPWNPLEGWRHGPRFPGTRPGPWGPSPARGLLTMVRARGRSLGYKQCGSVAGRKVMWSREQNQGQFQGTPPCPIQEHPVLCGTPERGRESDRASDMCALCVVRPAHTCVLCVCMCALHVWQGLHTWAVALQPVGGCVSASNPSHRLIQRMSWSSRPFPGQDESSSQTCGPGILSGRKRSRRG